MLNKDSDSWKNANRAPISVTITLTSGAALRGKLLVNKTKTLIEELNRGETFLEFEPFDGPKTYLARSAISVVKQVDNIKTTGMDDRMKDFNNYDPYAVLGVKPDADAAAIRSAYLHLAKIYHPDRFAKVDLPTEVADYLSAVVKRINLAYGELRRDMPSFTETAA